nr:4-(cytidine 5'-diphospho)-2-C-methyl-D-erythritol kinase [[Clostridium] aminophilum]
MSLEEITMEQSLRLRAYGKINLGLDVTGTREDGYHLVRMIMQSVRIYDRITVTRKKTPGIVLHNSLSFLPTDRRNLAYRAAELLFQETGMEDTAGVEIRIEKYLPVAAGMAGGSTDAAAVLYGVNRLFRMGFDEKKLCELGLRLGADVPFCVMRGTVLAEGIGEELTKLPDMPDCSILVVKPDFPVSTKQVYQDLDAVMPEYRDHSEEAERFRASRPDIDGLIRAISAGSIGELLPCMGNVLEQVTVPAHPEIAEIAEKMEALGADRAMMSGSGPTVFGIFRSGEAAENAYRTFREDSRREKDGARIYLTQPYAPLKPEREVRK